MTSNTHLAALLALLLGTAAQSDAHRYRTHHNHNGRRLFHPSFETATAEAFRPFQAPPRGSGLFTSAGPLVDVFQEVMSDVKRAARELSEPTPAAAGTPPHEVAETEDAAILTADLPGCKKEDVDAQISEDGGTKTLTIRAVRKKSLLSRSNPPETSAAATAAGPAEPGKDTPPGSASSSSSSSSFSSPLSSPAYTEETFELSFLVGDEIDVSGIRGSLEDGVLTLMLPKLAPEPPAEPIEIPIDFAAGSRSAEAAAPAAASVGRGGVSEEISSTAGADTHISLA